MGFTVWAGRTVHAMLPLRQRGMEHLHFAFSACQPPPNQVPELLPYRAVPKPDGPSIARKICASFGVAYKDTALNSIFKYKLCLSLVAHIPADVPRLVAHIPADVPRVVAHIPADVPRFAAAVFCTRGHVLLRIISHLCHLVLHNTPLNSI